ncbi:MULTISPECIES: 2'-5' RNA ligase family protein [unclassified Actinomyces]|uniref:2'-5' RNA ligase family protein n=1 Tax=unclassified Actinomyces TaxID=2609248 RepID=UPI0013738DBF|nr:MULTISPECIES: 2'-5' RNA ligase family protein [unclassified Actinomyces]MBW3068371.1 2'-5' RNA ligase family protein [Actinomyces sp. 594]NDR53782.1 2'-5' RNA ligase family protein [Actinomyces sp. 565]QHO90553.1 2'-5' RNA ligase [Actinomyces sp. 432]
MDVPVPAPSQCVLGVTIVLPEPWATRVRSVRTAVGDPHGNAIPPHITLLPPTAVDKDDLAAVTAHVSRVAARTAPFNLRAAGVGTFRPVSPVVFLGVAEGAGAIDALQQALRADDGPLRRTLRFPFHPHVTLAHEVDDDALDRAARSGSDIAAAFVVDRIHLQRLASDGSWVSLATPALGVTETLLREPHPLA